MSLDKAFGARNRECAIYLDIPIKLGGIAAHGNDGNPQFQGIGVLASGESMGVQASSASGTGVSATSGSGYGVSATSTTGVGLHAVGGGATGSATPPYAQAEHP